MACMLRMLVIGVILQYRILGTKNDNSNALLPTKQKHVVSLQQNPCGFLFFQSSNNLITSFLLSSD